MIQWKGEVHPASKLAESSVSLLEMTDDIGKQLTYAALEKQGMPKHEIAELIASYCKNAIPTFSPPQITRFLTGERDILLEVAEKLCVALGLELTKIDDSAG